MPPPIPIGGRQCDKAPAGEARSRQWPAVRKAHLLKFPTCAVCGGTKKLEVHHIVPFHKDRSLELEESNLLTLCENKRDGLNCHLFVGHLGNFQSWNVNVIADAGTWADKIKTRPM